MSDEGPREFTDPLAPQHHEHDIRTPTDELTHEQKLARQRTHSRSCRWFSSWSC